MEPTRYPISSHRSATIPAVRVFSLLLPTFCLRLRVLTQTLIWVPRIGSRPDTTHLAQKFLSSLDDNPQIGSLIDQTMDYEYEQEQMRQKTGQELSPKCGS